MEFAPPPGANALVTVPSQPGVPAQLSGTSLFNVLIDPPQPSIRFTIQQVDAGQPATAFFSAFDRCGRWQSLSGAGKAVFGQVGAFNLAPGAASIAPGQSVPFSLRWSVPPPAVWRSLANLRLRISGPEGVVFQIRWDEATDAFVVESSTGLFELVGPSAQGSGATGQSVTLALPIRGLPGAAGRAFTLEVQGTNDSGEVQGFESTGIITIGLAQLATPPGQPATAPAMMLPPQQDRDQPRRLTQEQRQQRRRTDRSSLDDTRTEGAVLRLDCAARPPTVIIGAMDGEIVLRLHGDAASTCAGLTPGAYVLAEGEKVHELLYDVDYLDPEN
jgi:hypothetical protein